MKKLLFYVFAATMILGTVFSCKEDDEPAVYKVVFNSQGGSTIQDALVEEGDKITKPGDPVRDNYQFINWTTSATGGTVWNFATDVVTGNITLYAQWESSGREALDLLIASAGELSEDDYTPDSWAVFWDALDAAKAVAADPNATEDQISKAISDLETAQTNLVLKADKGALNDAIDAAEGLNEADYTADSWADFQDALDAAKEVAADPNATEDEMSKALTDLKTAQDNLVEKADKGDLSSALDEAKGLNEDDYTADSWSDFQDALDAAQAVADDPDATEKEISDALSNLKDAQDNLVKKADKSDLTDAIDAADGLNEDDYTEDSWKDLQDALDAAKDVADDPDATEDDLSNALSDLEDALDNLVPVTDKGELNSAIAAAERLNEADYTAESWAALQDALDIAKSVAADPNATESAISDALSGLRTAVENLVDKADKSALNNAIAAAESLDETDYTADSWSALQDALAAAKSVAADPDATETQISNALSNLQDAMDDLVPIADADKSALNNAIAAAEGLDEADYTADSWADLETALAAAKSVAADPDATETQISNALSNLQDAIDSLVPIADKGSLNDAITAAEGLDETDYTADSWSALQDALDAAKAVAADPNATESAISDALSNLNDAIENLVPIADKGLLNDAITEAEGLTEADYTPDSWADLETALTAAQAVAADPNATATQISDALSDLNDAIGNLVDKADKGLLNDAIAEAEGLTEADYTPDSWSALQDALDAAKTVAADPNATETEISNALSALQDAIDNLAADKTALNNAITAAEGLNEANYTPDSWAALATTLAAAKIVAANNAATATQISDATTALTTAQGALVDKADKTQLNAAITAVGALTETDYTPASWATLEAALTAAQAVAADDNATQAEVSQALSNLQAAQSGLVTALADKTALNAAITASTGLQQDNSGFLTGTLSLLLDPVLGLLGIPSIDEAYTPASWANFQTALTAAQTVSADASASQAEVDAATSALETARGNLETSGWVRDLLDYLADGVAELAAEDLNNPITKPLAQTTARLLDVVRDLLKPVLGGVDGTFDALDTTLNGLLGDLGLTGLI